MEIINKQLCEVSYEMSKIVDYKPTSRFAGHKYLSLVLKPVNQNILATAVLGSRSTYTKNFFPLVVNGQVDAGCEKALIDAFNAKGLPQINVGRAVVEIPPTYMKSSATKAFVMDSNGKPRIYTTVQMVVLLDENGNSLEDENTVRNNVDRMRAQRIQQGTWAPAAAAHPEPAVLDDTEPALP